MVISAGDGSSGMGSGADLACVGVLGLSESLGCCVGVEARGDGGEAGASCVRGWRADGSECERAEGCVCACVFCEFLCVVVECLCGVCVCVS